MIVNPNKMNVRLRHEAIIRSLRRNGSSTIAELTEQVRGIAQHIVARY
jgi:hypothetical protein